MSAIEWYYAKGDQQKGPVSSAELKQLAQAGQIVPTDLVWREGMTEWVAASNVRGLFEAAAKPADAAPPAEAAATPPEAPAVKATTPSERVHGRRGDHVFDSLLDSIRAQFTTRFIQSTTKVFVQCGNFGLYGAMTLSLLFWLFLAIKGNKFNDIMPGLGFLLALAVLQYIANRFCRALDRLNRTTSGHIQSQAFPDAFALLNIVLGIGVLVFMTVMAIQTAVYSLIVLGLVIFVVCQYLAFISLNLGCLNMTVVESSDAGEESIGVMSFLLKAVTRLVPVGYGAGMIYAGFLFLYAFYVMFVHGVLPAAEGFAYVGAFWAVGSAALPFAGYLLFLIYYLWVAVVRAILAIPGKLDVLAGKEEGE